MLSLTRRQLLIGGATVFAVPRLGFASAEKLVLSGRVTGANGRPLAGARLPLGTENILTDADGRFLLITDTQAFHAPDARRDADGTWRATLGITLG